jgi:predicted extracellular nuclease
VHRPARKAAVLATAAALAVTALVAPAAAAAEPVEPFISEYIEGSSNNKAIEIYNPTAAPIDLAAGEYAIRQYSNGSASAGLTLNLAGTLAPGDVYVVAHSSAIAAIRDQADQTTGSGLFNGDDAVALVKGGAFVDVIGQIGVDPGTEWGSGLTSTADNTLRRNADICVGDPDGSDAFDPAAQWQGFATDTFDGLGAHAAQCGDIVPTDPTVVINEFSASTAGTDVEFIELLATGGADLTGYAVLQIEGDASSPMGTLDSITTFGAADADGRATTDLAANTLENGTISLLLVTGDLPTAGTDLDANDDGSIDDGFGFTVVDAVAVNDGGAGDLTYGGTTLGVAYDGRPFAPGGASRIPDGTDTDTTSDWVRNDFDLAGIPGFTGTLVDGEAVNTPGAENTTEVSTDPGTGVADCEATVVTIGSVQGPGDTSPVVDTTVRIEGVVTGDFQAGGFSGYFVQDAGDGDPATSDAIFVYAPGGDEVAPGDAVHVIGEVTEFDGLTEIVADDVAICAVGAELPAATELVLPVAPEDYEPLEGMRVTLPQTLSILEYFEFGRYGTIDVGLDRQMTPTAVFEPGSPEADELTEQNLLERITIDDGRSAQNPDPAIHPNGEEFTLENSFRGGDTVTDVTGILDYRFDTWAIQPTQGADFAVENPRPEVPEVGGDVTVASFNVLNYFTTLTSEDSDARGADTAEEFERQEAKIVAAMREIDADVFGLIEIENNGTAVATLTEALNDAIGEEVYGYVDTGLVGTDAITTALVYKTATMEPVGDFALLTEAVDERWLDDKNRPALAQTFAEVESGETVTVVVNHLKSKGSSCSDVGDPDTGDGQANCAGVRTDAAAAMVDWLAGDPTGQGAGRELIIGDLNSYDKEDPIDVLVDAGYTDLIYEYEGENAYSYVFDGQLGYLDYALAGTDLIEDVTGAAVWRINADEPSLIDYDMSFKQDAQDALFAPDPYRSSDHDPVLVGLELTAPDTTDPTITATASPGVIFPPNNKERRVTIDIDAADDSGEVTVALTDTSVSGSRKAAVEQIDDTTFEVVAANKAVYTFEYTATDAAGNTATATVTVQVAPPGLLAPQ